MKKLFSIIAVTAFCWACAYGQTGGDRGLASLEIGGGKVSVDYGRPSLRGRDLEAMIQPGQEWRMGANSATTMTTDIALKFGDKAVPQGKYVLKAKLVAAREWVLMIQSEDKSVSVETPLRFQKAENSAEQMTISLEKAASGGRFVLQWGTLTLSTEFQKG
jgi:hypothetical protein